MSVVEPFPIDHPVLDVVVELAVEGWVGTATELMVRCEERGVTSASDPTRLAARLRRSHRTLDDRGVLATWRKVGGRRLLTLASEPPEPVDEPMAGTEDVAPRGVDDDGAPSFDLVEDPDDVDEIDWDDVPWRVRISPI